MKKNEKEGKALEENKKKSTEKVVSEKSEEIISSEDAEKLEGGIDSFENNTELSKPSQGCLGGGICCNG